MSFEATATAVSNGVTNLGREITASGTATAISATSYADALQSATIQAQNVSNTVANTSVSLVNVATDFVFTVSSLEDNNSSGTFRDCIIQNNKTQNSKIIFSVAGVIVLTSSLPVITSSCVIDGTTAPNYDPDGLPVVCIDCNRNDGIVFNVVYNSCPVMNGLEIRGSNNNGITLYSSYNTITNCVLTSNANNGLFLSGSSNNIIGALKYSTVQPGKKLPSNIISGNGNNGVQMYFSLNNFFYNNFIGTDSTGKNALPNGNHGVLVSNYSHYNTFGGPYYIDNQGVENNPTGSKGTVPPVFVIPPLGNVISGNLKAGISLESSQNCYFYGNFIGTSADGTTNIGNKGNGLSILNSNNTCLYGCTIDTNPFVYYNVISGNSLYGILIEYSSNTTIQGNFIGINSQNNGIIGNGLDGLYIGNTVNVVTVGGVIPLGNVISGNNGNGIHLSADSTGFETYNTFGGLFAFGGAAPNQQNGLLIDKQSGGHKIGKSATRTNVFSGNAQNGIEITDEAYDIEIEALICGANTDGNEPLPNNQNGIFIHGNSQNVKIGDVVNSIIPTNIISGNLQNGIVISDGSSGNSIYNCNIGTNVDQTANLANGESGILIDNLASQNVVRDYKGKNNVIVNNKKYGVEIGPTALSNVIINNYLGINRVGTSYPNVSGNFNENYNASNVTSPNYI